MYPDNQNRGTQPAPHNPLAVMQEGEKIVCEVRRHPIGMIGIYLMTGFLLVVLAIIVFAAAPAVLSSADPQQIRVIGGVAYLLFAVMAAVFVFISHYVYWNNRWIVTTDSITQITQTSLFDRQSAQLSLGNLEDITAEQNGILTHIFNYGVIKAETAGEREKFMFLYCPFPNDCAKKILGARESFELLHHGGKQPPLASPLAGQSPQPSYPESQPPAGPSSYDVPS